MSSAEIRHRSIEQFKRYASRLYVPKSIESFDNSAPLPTLPGIIDELSNFKNNEQLIKKWRDLAKLVTTKRLQFLNVQWPHEKTGNIWHLDPITKKQWPANVYCFQVNYRNTKKYGDAKYVWELNRLQYLQPLAALAALEKDDSLSKYCINEIESWIDNNPPFKGINWASGIELACRIVSILVVISLISNTLITPQQKNKFHKTLAFHGYWLMRYPSCFSSANNHLITEAGALYLLSKLAPYLPEADKWNMYAKETLLEEAGNQIHTDGVGVEQSPSYSAFTLEWLLLCGVIGKRLDDEFPSQYWQRIEKAGVFLRWITDTKGNQPNIGDNDEGRVFYSELLDELYSTSILACIASLTNRHDLAPPTYIPHLRNLFFGVSQTNLEKTPGIKCFDKGGYSISRIYINDIELLLAVDHGPLGYLSIAAHGHADSLAIWFHINGLPVIVDAGTYLYHSGGNWRDHMRSTPAHNTLSINGTSSSKSSSAFNWSTKAKCKLLEFSNNANYFSVCAEHDGYNQNFGVRHRRRVQQYENGSFIVEDTLHGSPNELPVEIGFLFHPTLTIQKQNNLWTVAHNNKLILEIEEQTNYLPGTIKQGKHQPLQGWYSETFGQITPAPRLTFEGKLKTGEASKILFKPITTA